MLVEAYRLFFVNCFEAMRKPVGGDGSSAGYVVNGEIRIIGNYENEYVVTRIENPGQYNLETIRARAREMGPETSLDGIPDDVVIDFVKQPGVSSKAEEEFGRSGGLGLVVASFVIETLLHGTERHYNTQDDHAGVEVRLLHGGS